MDDAASEVTVPIPSSGQDRAGDIEKNDKFSEGPDRPSDDPSESAKPAQGEAPYFPDGGYAWVVCICGFWLSAVTWGINSAFGVFLSFYLDNDYFPGATPLQFAFVGGLSLSCAMAVGPVSNFITKRYGTRWTMAFGSLFLAGGQIAAGFVTKIWQLFLTQGVMFAVGLGLIMVSNQPIVAQWFGKKRGLASGIAGAGSGAGGLIYSNLTRYLLQKKGLRWAFLVNGLTSAAVMLPCTILMKSRAKPLKARFEPFKVDLFRNSGFLSLVGWGLFSQLGYLVGLYSIPLFATAGLGFSQTQGSTLQSLLSAGQLLGRPLVGLFLDRVGRINGSSIVSVSTGIACLCIWMFSRTMPVLGLFAILQGALSGIFWQACNTLLVEIIGIRDQTSGISMLWLSIVPSATVAEPIAILLIDYSKDHLGRTGPRAFEISIGFAGASFIVSGLALFGAKFYKQKSRKIWVKA
ncbi:MAG: hypothetical protein CYPHOPRED_002145 [Cyphobasidiales sp. Tagirdzhanova-0007]|nr:MAG: hypothetical protein CYPHOPRED_002145 [Cyphobasidiales sp. Tagirdzhanova-0007]